MKRPIESDYISQVAYTRALEEYCDTLAQPEPAIIGTYLEKDKEQEPSPEWMTEEEQTAYTFGWFKALESKRMAQPEQEPVALEALKWIASHDLSGADDRAIALMAYAFVSKARFAVLEATGERA